MSTVVQPDWTSKILYDRCSLAFAEIVGPFYKELTSLSSASLKVIEYIIFSGVLTAESECASFLNRVSAKLHNADGFWITAYQFRSAGGKYLCLLWSYNRNDMLRAEKCSRQQFFERRLGYEMCLNVQEGGRVSSHAPLAKGTACEQGSNYA